MKLSPAAAAALEMMRNIHFPESGNSILNALYCLKDEMLRIFPPGHGAEITPERLVACGFAVHPFADHVLVFPPGDINGLSYRSHDQNWWWCLPWCDRTLDTEVAPRSMGEVWSLMERCGIEVKHVKE